MGLEDGRASSPPPERWRALTMFGRSLAASPPLARALPSRLIFVLVVAGAALPFAGWRLPGAWCLTMAALVLAARAWRERPAPPSSSGDSKGERFNPFDWLLSAGYSLSALYLVLFYTGAAQTLGVTLYGVVMFQILARNYDQPRRLLANLVPPVVSMVLAQGAAIALRLSQDRPLEVLTLLASPYIVFRVFRTVQGNLASSLARERAATAEAEETTWRIAEAHRIALMAETLSGVGHWSLDVATGAAFWSDSVFRIYGLDKSKGAPSFTELLAMHRSEDQAVVSDNLARAVREGKPFSTEVRFNRADGSVRHIAANGAAEKDENGEVISVFGALMDVTEARQREEALRVSEARFRMLADHGTDVVVWLALDGEVLYASPSVKSLGYTPEAVVGRKTIDFVHPGDRERAAEVLTQLFTDGPFDDTVRREYRVLTADGDYVWLEGNPTLIRDDEGRLTSAVTTYRDVTARRLLEDDLLDAKLRAEAAAEAKAEFLANMSHEIRTPLTGIIGFSGLLGALDDLPGPARGYVERIETSGQALLAVVNDILDFSKLEAGQVALDPRPFDVREMFEAAVAGFATQAEAKAIALDLVIDPDTPRHIDADGARLGQVLNNLLGNAIKFTDRGSVSVAVGYRIGDQRLEVAVTDTGVGVPKDRLDRLFQRFSQVDGSVSRRYGGTGLGLSICKTMVELMGGEISVFSTPGVGSTFEFWVAAPTAGSLRGEGPAAERPVLDLGRPAKILVVDDLAVNRELIRAILSAAGQEVEEAASGAEAVDAAIRTGFDLILMDLQMPGMDGFSATRAIRRIAALNRATPIVALSANVLAEHVEASAAAGMNDHVGKPISPADLLGAVARWASVRLTDPDGAEQHRAG